MTVSQLATPPIGQMRRLRNRRLAVCLHSGRVRLGGSLVGLVLFIAIFGSSIAPHSPTEYVGTPFASPSTAALLGTDYLGEDVLSRVLCGGWSVVWMALSATAIGFILGVAVGLLASWASPVVGDSLMGAADIALAFPQIVLALLFVSILGPKLLLIVAIVAASHAPRVARLARATALDTKHKEFVEAAAIAGAPRSRILLGEVLPNISTPLLVEFGIRLTWSIGVIAGLSFLGLGIQPPRADWGLMINQNRNGLVIQPWSVAAPIMLIALFAIGTNLVAEGLARALAGIDRASDSR
jgi:peptide/nickel transport system permease protein